MERLMKLLKRANGGYMFRWLWALPLLLAVACAKDEDTRPIRPAVAVQKPEQYDVPFGNVPAAADIALYEVNFWAFNESATLDGVKARLDDLKALGVNVVWLMPVYEIGELNSVGSPYAVKNYKKINPSFGTLEDLRSLVKEAHTRDMAVMLDWVANHTAWDNEWIQNKNWYTQDASGNIISPAGTEWNDVADLNFGSSAMRREMISAMKYWLLEANVDGFRCDYADGVPVSFWKQAIDSLRAIPNRDVIMFAEGRTKALWDAGFDLIFGWDFYGKLRGVYDNNAAVNTIVEAHNADYNGVTAGKQVLRWITNHDDNWSDDTPVNIFHGQDGALAAFVASTYLGGVPLIYSGQEVGFNTKLNFFQNSTAKINWGVNPGTLEQYQKLMNFRNGSAAIKTGTLENFSNTDVLAFKKVAGEEEVIVLVNLRGAPKELILPASLAGTTRVNVMTNEGITLNNSKVLQAYEYVILKK